MVTSLFLFNSRYNIDIPLGYSQEKDDLRPEEEQVYRILRLLSENLSKRGTEKLLQRRPSHLPTKFKQLNCALLLR